MSLPKLFCVAYNRGFPHSAARAVIRDLADSVSRVRVDRLTERMMQAIAECLEGMTYDARHDPAGQSRAREEADPCAEHHRDEIRTQASRLGWTVNLLKRFLAGRGWPEELHKLTRDQAEECLARMNFTAETQRIMP